LTSAKTDDSDLRPEEKTYDIAVEE